jgi:succinyl-diaminopimelate desuccinylase
VVGRVTDTANLKREALGWIDQDRDRLVAFFADLVRAPSPNPPGDTRAATDVIVRFLAGEGLAHRIIAPKADMPNIVASFEGARPGRHLALNGHIDTYPVTDEGGWTRAPFSGEVAEGRVHGRGSGDMKCGTSALTIVYAYLHRLRDRLPGKVTLTAVSDEETGGIWGIGYLFEHHPDVIGDCCLNGEPGSPDVVRIGEKGPLWARFTVTGPAGHGGYPNRGGVGAIARAAHLIVDLEAVTKLEPDTPQSFRDALERARPAMERGLGVGVVETVQAVTLNIGKIQGGQKISLKPTECVFDADIRLPIGVSRERLMDCLAAILSKHPDARMDEIIFAEPNASDPDGEMALIIQDNVEALRGFRPPCAISIGGSDGRYWRYRGIPAYIYGPAPVGTAAADESVGIDEFFHVLRTHLCSAIDYLARSPTLETGESL